MNPPSRPSTLLYKIPSSPTQQQELNSTNRTNRVANKMRTYLTTYNPNDNVYSILA